MTRKSQTNNQRQPKCNHATAIQHQVKAAMRMEHKNAEQGLMETNPRPPKPRVLLLLLLLPLIPPFPCQVNPSSSRRNDIEYRYIDVYIYIYICKGFARVPPTPFNSGGPPTDVLRKLRSIIPMLMHLFRLAGVQAGWMSFAIHCKTYSLNSTERWCRGS